MEIIPLSFENITPESLNGASIRKHNDLIEAKYQLPNLQEQRIILMLLGQIKMNDEDFKCYRITVTDFAEILGLRVDGMYDELEKTLKSLMSRIISIKNGKSFLLMSWLSSAEYKSGSGYIELAFDPKLKPYLLQLKSHFTQYKIDTVLHFKSVYTIRLYELLKKEEFKAKKGAFTVFFEYADLREHFGIGKKEYLKFNNFKQKAIQPAISEISDKTDLIVNDVKYGKTGRKITNLTFVVGIRSESETKLRQANLRIDDIKPEKESEHHAVIDSLVSLGFSLETAKAYKTKHGIKKIERNIAYTLAKKQAGKVGDIPAYLNTAIENDYGGAWDIEQKKEEEKKKKVLADQKIKEEKENESKKIIAEQYKFALQAFYQLPDDRQAKVKQDFISSYEKGNFVANEWFKAEREKKNPIDKPLIKGTFTKFLIDNSICVVE
jgi:plasmid replication initiation protein